MGVYIKGIEMPKEGSWKTIRIYPDGTCAVPNWQGDCTFIKGTKAVPILKHGRLIDSDALLELIKEAKKKQPEISDVYDEDYFMVAEWIAYAPTVIESEDK